MESMLEKEWPHPALRSGPEMVVLSVDREIHQAISYFLGFGRSYPPEILDDELLLIIKEHLQMLGPKGTADYFKSVLSHELRAQCRAVLMNLTKMRRENGGHYPWDW